MMLACCTLLQYVSRGHKKNCATKGSSIVVYVSIQDTNKIFFSGYLHIRANLLQNPKAKIIDDVQL